MCSLVDKQRMLIAALHNGSIIPHADDDWQLIETHISWVILCGDFAYKIKKALDLGFLDCTTLDSRRFYCEEELRLNSRLAPSLYLHVVAITGTIAAPRLNGEGAPLEFAVKMQRFPARALLSELVAHNEIVPEHIDQLIVRVAEFHLRIRTATVEMAFGDPSRIHAPALENFDQLEENVDDPRHRASITRLREWTETEFQRRSLLFEQRKQMGFVRECHGDMHLGNMVLIDGVPTIFDGVEFNPDLYWIDVMSEVAFLIMDLQYHGRRDYAFRFLNGYLERTGDYAGLGIFHYYLVYRAMVRAKVASIRALQQGDNETKAVQDVQLDRYFQIALTNTQVKSPSLFITHGLSGSGKSTLSARIVEALGAIRIRSDRERQRLLGTGHQHGQPAAIDSGVYSSKATAQTYATLARLAASVIDAGYSVIVDATFLDRRQRQPFFDLADRLGVPLRILSFRADVEVLQQRITERQRKGQDISEAGLEVLAHQLSEYTELDTVEAPHTVVIDTEASCTGSELAALINASLPTTHKSQDLWTLP